MKRTNPSPVEKGKSAELLAKDWLSSKEYAVIAVNWRYSHFEIDIIASKSDTLHFIEEELSAALEKKHREELRSLSYLLAQLTRPSVHFFHF